MRYRYIKLVFGTLVMVLPAVTQAQNANGPATVVAQNTAAKPGNKAVSKNNLTKTQEPVADSLLNTINPDDGLTQVQVAHRVVNKKDLAGDVTAVNVAKLLEKNYTLSPLENMDGFANGFHGNIWGMDSYQVLVDGFPRDASSVMPTEIESVTFLKGVAAVALYGSRAAKGVVYITTKRGAAHDLKVRARVNTGVFVPKGIPRYLGAAEYMTLYNEARLNDNPNSGKQYTEEDIYRTASGTNPYRYPDVDYYSEDYLKKSYNRYDGTVEFSGGNKIARYYSNVGYNSAGSLLNFGQALKNNTSDRLNVRGNVDVQINDFMYAKVDAAAIYSNQRGVNTDYWANAATLRPNRFAPLLPVSMVEESDQASWQRINGTRNLIDGKYILGGTQADPTNPIATIYAGGSTKNISRQFQFNTGVGANLENVLKGLSFESTFGVDYATAYTQSFNNTYAVFEASWNNYAGGDLITGLTPRGNNDVNSGILNASNATYRQTLALTGQFNYRNTFAGNHNVSAILLANGYQQSISGAYHKVSNANLGLHLGYNFRNKYYADFNGAMVHSARLPEANRQAFSPTLSLAWRISEENFLESSSVINNLKLTASAGRLHTDLNIHDYYLYTSIYNQTEGSWYSWRDGALNRTTDSRRGENPNLTFAKRDEVNVGLQAGLFKDLIQLEGAFFINKITGNMVQASVLYPSYFATNFPASSFIPWVNYNDDQRTGFDFNLKLNKNIGEAGLTLGFVGTYYETKATKRAEMFEDKYQNRAGRPMDAIYGLQNQGFFKDQADIDGSPTHALGQVKPGDIKYVDQNGDGVVNAQDEVYLGRGGWYGSPLTLGLNLTARYRNFTFFALGLGRYGAVAMKNSSYFRLAGETKYSEVARNRWTEATKETATYPRLTTTNADNNFRSSDFWMYKNNRIDLAKVQISYDLPENALGKSFLSGLGIYANGFNLLTVAKEREIMEMNIGSAPQTRFYNLGIKAAF